MPSRARALILGMVIGHALTTPGAAGQVAARAADATGPKGSLGRADSLRVLREMKNAQTRFESVRRHRLTRGWSSGGSRCDDRIGRFCYWDDGNPAEDALPDSIPPEPERTIAARDTLLIAFDSASRRLPGDEWISAHHVRYLIEAGRADSALARAQRCAAIGWWCEALKGMALHATARYAESDSTFALAIAMMPAAERCDWIDLTDLLDEPMHGAYRKMTCDERMRVADRLWWLTDPLHSREGNDRRTEHYTRVLLDRMHWRTASGYGVSWGSDIGELVRRYGWATYFEQALPQPYRLETAPSIIAHHRDPAYHFFPTGGLDSDLAWIGEDSWSLRGPRLRETYAPDYATFASLRQLTTLFRRGDSVLILSAYDVDADTLLGEASISARLVASAGPFAIPPVMAYQTDAPRRGTLTVRAPDTPAIASIEIVGEKRIRRARMAVGFNDSLTRRVQVSGLALFDPGSLSHPDSVPVSIDALIPVARASPTVSRAERLGLYWEMYGVDAVSGGVFLRVDVVRDGQSWLRRAGERIGVIGKDGGMRMTWQDDSRNPASVIGRSVVIDLATLDPGQYRVELQLWLEGERPTTASRVIEVTR